MTKNENKRKIALSMYVRARKELGAMGLCLHHTTVASGYFRIDEVRVTKYKGRYGAGYKVEYHLDNTRYHAVDYMIK